MAKRTLTTRTGAANIRRVRAAANASRDDELRLKKERVRSLKSVVDRPKLIGAEEELIPFSWRHPLLPPEDAKMSKVYREVVALEKSLTFHKDTK